MTEMTEMTITMKVLIAKDSDPNRLFTAIEGQLDEAKGETIDGCEIELKGVKVSLPYVRDLN